jgi:hypothetical protein
MFGLGHHGLVWKLLDYIEKAAKYIHENPMDSNNSDKVATILSAVQGIRKIETKVSKLVQDEMKEIQDLNPEVMW